VVRPLRRENLPAAIAAELRRQIEQGELARGEQLPGHRELAAMFSVSVGSVREAISMLVSEGLVETRAGRGTYVADPGDGTSSRPRAAPPLGRHEIEELIEARELLELQLATLAAKRATREQVANLRRALERIQAAAESPDEYPEADVEFHLALAEAAGNRYLVHAMADIRELLRQDIVLGAEAAIRRFGSLRPSVDSHRRLVDAVEAGNAEAAQGALREIVDRNHRFVLGLHALATSPSAE
jgi:DNA-binding FadR family transcriptional regulator